MSTRPVAVVGTLADLAEPGCGRRVDAAQVFRTGPAPSGTEDRLGARAGSRIEDGLALVLERLVSERCRAFLCGFDPEPVRDAVVAGVEAGLFELSGSMHRVLGIPLRDHALDPSYVCNPVAYFDDTGNQDEWQKEVYDHALTLARERGFTRILDVGCGSGYKLVHWFPEDRFRTIGLDLPETVAVLADRYQSRRWLAVDLEREDMLRFSADLIIVSDIIEHLANPDLLLRFLLRCDAEAILISTPDAATLVDRGQADPLGPPRNVHHVREWTKDQFARYVAASLEVTSQHLYAPNATQMLVCRLPGRPRAVDSPPAPSAPHASDVARLQVPYAVFPQLGSVSGWDALDAEDYALRSRTRALERWLVARDEAYVTLRLGRIGEDHDVERLERAVRSGAEIALCPCAEPSRAWSALDGIAALCASRARLLEAIRSERGPHGVERALLALAAGSARLHVDAPARRLDPHELLARLDAMIDLLPAGPEWPDPRPVLGPFVRAAIEAADRDGAHALARDLDGFWAAQTGGSAEAIGLVEKDGRPAHPELAVSLDPRSIWTPVDARSPDAFGAVLAHAARADEHRTLNLVAPWAAGVPIGIFAERVVAALREADLHPAHVAPIVVLERPLWHAEIAWLRERVPRA